MKKKLEFTKEELNLIIYALQELPHKHVDGIINNIVAQVKALYEAEKNEVNNKE